jgi:hypothetical protein
MANTKIPVELSSTPGIVDNSNATAITIDSNENVGIGNSAPSDTLELGGGNIVNPNNTGSEITSATFGIGQNIHLEERQVDGAFSDRTDLAIVTNTGFGIGESEKVRIQASGNVGIGRTPAQKLDVNGNIRISDNTFGGYLGKGSDLVTGGGTTDFVVRSDNVLIFAHSGPYEAMRIDTSGNLLVGTTSSDALLHIAEAANKSEADAHFRITGSGYSGHHWLDGTAYYIGQNSAFRSLRIYSSAETAGVNLAAGGTSWGTFSDERLKENIQDIGSVIEKIKDIRCVTYTRNDLENAQETIGFIAQDFIGKFDQVLDELKVSDSDEETRYSIRYTETIPVLLKAIQEQQTLIESLEARITALES